MAAESLKSRVAKGAMWSLLEKLSTQLMTFVVGMVLSRLLTPNDYGTVALTVIFFAVANVLVDGGFGNALIQKKNADEIDFNSVFYVNLGLSAAGYACLFFGAPWISRFYDVPELVSIIRLSGVTLIFNAVSAVQNAELTKKMLFRLSFQISLATSISSSVCGITLAFLGFEVWSLVWANLVSGFVGMIARWLIIAWRPKMVFSLARLKPLLSYGWKMAISSLIDQIYVNLSGLLIGKFYSKADLAYVNKGRALPNLAMSQIDATLGRVSFPAMVLIQDDKLRLRDSMRKMMQCSTFIVFPSLVGVAVCSSSILRLLYGSQWLSAAPYMMISCFMFALWPFHTINLRGIMALGRSDVFLKLEILKKSIGLVVMILALKYSVLTWMIVTAFALGPLSVVINSWPNRKLLDYRIKNQIADVMPTILICLVEAGIMLGLGWSLDFMYGRFECPAEGWGYMVFLGFRISVQFLTGLGLFLCLAYQFRLEPLEEYARICNKMISRRFPRLAAMLAGRFGL